MYLTKKENGSKKSQGQLSHDRKDNPAPITLFNRGMIGNKGFFSW